MLHSSGWRYICNCTHVALDIAVVTLSRCTVSAIGSNHLPSKQRCPWWVTQLVSDLIIIMLPTQLRFSKGHRINAIDLVTWPQQWSACRLLGSGTSPYFIQPNGQCSGEQGPGY
jgi:hypothetical protein